MAAFDYQAAVFVLGLSVGQTMEVLWVDVEASEEKDLQVCLKQIITQLLLPHQPQSSLTIL